VTTPDHARVWEHVAEWSGVAALTAFAAIALGPQLQIPGWAPAIIWCAIAIVGAITAGVLMESGAAGTWVLALGGWLAGWSAWAGDRGIWHAVVVVAWLIGLLILVPAGALIIGATLRRQPKPAALEAAPDDAEAARQRELEQWDHMWSELGFTGVVTEEVARERGNRVARITLPRTGQVTLRRLEEAAQPMEVIFHLQPNSVDFEHGSHSGEAVVRLRETDSLADSVSLTKQYYARTITKPIPVGMLETGPVATIKMREIHGYIVGMTGAGKSNLLNVLIGQTGRCVDTIIWAIDMKGGRFARPWIQPWINEEADSPVFDWVATTREEAALMMNCFIAAIDTRSRSGKGGSKINPKASMPQIILLTDEMAVLFSPERGRRGDLAEGATTNFDFLAKAVSVIQMGRSEACSSIWATQRGTNSMAGSNDMKSQCDLKILLGVADEAEARYLLTDDRAAQKRAAAARSIRGAGVIQQGRTSTPMVKFFHHDHPLDPDSETEQSLCEDGCVPECPVRKSAIEIGRMRPKMDLMTAQGMGEDYARRWERARDEGLLTRAAPVITAAVETDSFEDIMTGGGMSDPEKDTHPARVRMREILAARGVTGATPKTLGYKLEEDGLPVARETIQRWLAKDAEKDYVHQARFGLWRIGPDPARQTDPGTAA